MSSSEDERLRRWRLILGGAEADGTGLNLSAEDMALDRTLSAVYDAERTGGLGNSAPAVARWLGDIRTYFPTSVVRLLQKDAFERLRLKQMLLEPELLQAVEPDVHLAATLISLSRVMPARTRDTARQVIRQVVDDLMRRLEHPLRQAVGGSLTRAVRNRRPRLNEMDWPRTIRANLRHYQPEYRTIIPEQQIGFGRRRSSLKHLILCLDQSGSMANSVVYAGVCGAVLASIPSLRTSVIAFDTSVVDLTEDLHDPVELLFGIQLGGGTDIHRALTYCQGLITRPEETILVLLTDLYEGGSREGLLKQVSGFLRSGVQVIVLLALSDNGSPGYDHHLASSLAALGVPAFACTPDLFPDLMAAAISRREIVGWLAERGIVAAARG